MTPGEFIEVFDTVAEAPGGIERLRELVLQLAVRGRLVPQDSGAESAAVLLEHIAEERARLVRAKKIGKQKPVPDLDHSATAVELPSGWTWTCTAALGVVNPRNVAEDDAMVSFCPMPVIPTDYRQPIAPETRRWGEIKKGLHTFRRGRCGRRQDHALFSESQIVRNDRTRRWHRCRYHRVARYPYHRQQSSARIPLALL